MFKINQWKKIFGYSAKEKVSLRIGDSLAKFTDTQIGRLAELKARRRSRRGPETRNVLDQARYNLEEAAFRLLIGEDQLLQEAVSGSLGLCVDAGHLRGHWRQESSGDHSRQSTVQTLRSGFLRLPRSSCRELVESGGIYVSLLELRGSPDPAVTGLEPEIIAALSTWGGGIKYFCLQEPLWVNRDKIVLLPPLKLGRLSSEHDKHMIEDAT